MLCLIAKYTVKIREWLNNFLVNIRLANLYIHIYKKYLFLD